MTESQQAAQNHDEHEPTYLSHRQIMSVLAGLMMGMFLSALDQTIVATAIRTIGDDLQGLSLQAWVTTAYLITATITTPLYGKLGDIYGRKKLFLWSIGIFIVGSVMCTFANSMYQLAGFRAVQGIGAGGLFSLALAIIGDIVPPRERAKYQGAFLAVFGTASVLGPLVGGFFAGTDSIIGITGWRWVFLVNVPIGVVALLVVQATLHVPHRRLDHAIDWWGAAALITGLVPLLTIAEQGREWGWQSSRAFLCYGIGLIGIIAFVFIERAMKEEALLPLRFFSNRTFALTNIVGFIMGAAMFGGLAGLPLYLQIVKGATPTRAGLLLIPLTLGIMLGSVASGQIISRTGRYKVFPLIGASSLIVALGLLSTVKPDTSLVTTGLLSAFFGFGLGNLLQPTVLAVQNAVSPRDIGVATSSATFFRQMGGTLGTAVFLSVLFNQWAARSGTEFKDAASDPNSSFSLATRDPQVLAQPQNKKFLETLQQMQSGTGGSKTGAFNDTSFLSGVAKGLTEPLFKAFTFGMSHIFLIASGATVIALALLFFLPNIPLRGRGAGEAAPAGGH
ncbi:MAG: DHA2 family efflux MFS transporter permease subunit [Actinobacteria bacterium]|nr:DHA2 family efflux MFS transporter permease subunit [Actinomycetota bacterium]